MMMHVIKVKTCVKSNGKGGLNDKHHSKDQ